MSGAARMAWCAGVVEEIHGAERESISSEKRRFRDMGDLEGHDKVWRLVSELNIGEGGGQDRRRGGHEKSWRRGLRSGVELR